MDILGLYDEKMYMPSKEMIDDAAKISGDIMVLGAGGKMGIALCITAKRAFEAAGRANRVIAVSRFSNPEYKKQLEDNNIQIISADLFNPESLEHLPETENIIYMVGRKFGTDGEEHMTWAVNAFLPGLVCEKFKTSNIVMFSTGNVYPLVPVISGGADESETPGPIGEYAASCLGRERIFEHFSNKYNIKTLLFRLNYAIDLRYGILVDIAKLILEDKEIDVSMGHVNLIWQKDANERAIRSLLHTAAPAAKLNITGAETLSVRWIANELGRRLGKTPKFTGTESENALLSNAAESNKLFGYPKTSILEMMDMTALWLEEGGNTINKPTKFQQRKGKF